MDGWMDGGKITTLLLRDRRRGKRLPALQGLPRDCDEHI